MQHPTDARVRSRRLPLAAVATPSFTDASTLADLLLRYEEHARATLPPAAYDFIATGAGEEISQREAVDSWRRLRLRPHALRDVGDVDTSLSLLGLPLPAPIVVAPTAYHSLACADAEVATARGVRAASGLMTVATRSSTAHDQVAAALDGPWWFQVYMSREREITRRMVPHSSRVAAGRPRARGPPPRTRRRAAAPTRTLAGGDRRSMDAASRFCPRGQNLFLCSGLAIRFRRLPTWANGLV